MENIIIIALVLLIVTFSGVYIYKEKKKGKKCIGCPNAASCCSGSCGSCDLSDTAKEN